MITIKRICLITAVVLASIFTLCACSKTPQEQFRAAMLDLADNEKFFKQLATTLHLSGDKKKLVAEHFKQMFTPYYVDYYIKKLDEEGLFKTEKPSEKLVYTDSEGAEILSISKKNKITISKGGTYSSLAEDNSCMKPSSIPES